MIKKKYPEVWIYKACDRFTSGIPDILLCFYGVFVALELKFGSNKPSKIQEWQREKIERGGGYFQYCYNLEDAEIFLKAIKGGIDDG